MAFPQGFDFRNTSAFTTDTAPNEFWQAATYPTTSAQGNTAGWVATTGLTFRDRSGQLAEPRMAGGAFISGASTQDFRVDLPSAGTYTFVAGHGDSASSQTTTAEVFDNTTSLVKYLSNFSGATAAFTDANGGSFADVSAWASGNTSRSLTFSSTTFKLRIGGSTSGNSWLNHFRLDAAAGGTDATVNLTGVSATGALGTISLQISPNITLSGVSATGSIGSVSVTTGGNASVNVTGVAGSGAVGSVSVGLSPNVTLSGVAGTGAIGTLTASGATLVSITGVSATGAVNTVSLTVSSNFTITGVSGTGFVGEVSVTGATASIWTAVTPAGGTWTPTTPASGIWTAA
jgi:hypothetical protein